MRRNEERPHAYPPVFVLLFLSPSPPKPTNRRNRTKETTHIEGKKILALFAEIHALDVLTTNWVHQSSTTRKNRHIMHQI
jgi:hypothetical protein